MKPQLSIITINGHTYHHMTGPGIDYKIIDTEQGRKVLQKILKKIK